MHSVSHRMPAWWGHGMVASWRRHGVVGSPQVISLGSCLGFPPQERILLSCHDSDRAHALAPHHGPADLDLGRPPTSVLSLFAPASPAGISVFARAHVRIVHLLDGNAARVVQTFSVDIIFA